ncbi:hypothetical protein ABEB36_006517 [Hypothenemus hampei]|uniref:INO80 complex subunit B-like conserved region domain-containing protein n=1 Tax=Hypothenemus hampei TaxID=57062 RepID=A0ABD1ET19_HYPHA
MDNNEEQMSKKSKKAAKTKKSTRSAPSDDGSSSNELVIVDESAPMAKQQPKSVLNSPKPGSSTNSSNSKKRKKRDSASSDEERWLTAIESGKLEDVDDELKKIKPKDPSLMTARQRAMYERGGDGNLSTPTLMSLPTGYKEKVMTAEAIQKAAIKSQKRKQLADEKREKDKKKTMERLLKKQDSKATKQTKSKTTKTNAPVIIYRQNCESTIVSFPDGMEYPLKPSKVLEPTRPVMCIMNCGNFKKYSCSRTGVPLCSLECYKQNILDCMS